MTTSSDAITYSPANPSRNDSAHIERVPVTSGRRWSSLSTTKCIVGVALLLLAAKVATAQIIQTTSTHWTVSCCQINNGMCWVNQPCKQLSIPVTNETITNLILPFERATRTSTGYSWCKASCNFYNQVLRHGTDYSTFVFEEFSGAPLLATARVVTLVGLFALWLMFE